MNALAADGCHGCSKNGHYRAIKLWAELKAKAKRVTVKKSKARARYLEGAGRGMKRIWTEHTDLLSNVGNRRGIARVNRKV